MTAFLGHIGRRQIDGDALVRKRQAHGRQRRAHAFARFADRLVRQTHDVEDTRAAIADMHLHIDFARFDPLERNRVDMRKSHRRPPGRLEHAPTLENE